MEWFAYFACFLIGAVCSLLLQISFIMWYIWYAPASVQNSSPPPKFHLPETLENMGLYSDSGDCAAAVSLTLQFLLQELKYSPAPLAWLHRKLQQEMIELLTRTTSGRLFESLTVRNVSTGNSAPRVRWAGVQNIDATNDGRLKTVDILLDIFYSGGFRLAVDAGFLGKTACFDIEVEQLSGRARVRFTRDPYTHWSLSFLNPPHLELSAKPLKGRLAALLQAHARRALQKKHTLPNYTIRYKPFFTKVDPSQIDLSIDDSLVNVRGNLEIDVVEITRLFTKPWLLASVENQEIFCTLSVDSSSWISYRQNEEFCIFTLDIVVNKNQSEQLGTVFKQISSDSANKATKTIVIVETVVPLSAAFKADLRRHDIILAVDSKSISTMNQIAKIIKNINRPCFTIRVERKMKRNFAENEKNQGENHLLTADTSDAMILKREKSNSFSFKKMSEVLESAKNVGHEGRTLLKATTSNCSIQEMVNKAISDSDNIDSQDEFVTKSSSNANSISSSKPNESIQIPFSFGIRKRRCSVENKTSSDSSNSSTPNTSSPGTPSKRNDKSSNVDLHKPNIHYAPKDLSNISKTHPDSVNIDLQKSDNNKIQMFPEHDLPNEKSINPRISSSNFNNEIHEDKARFESFETNNLLQSHSTRSMPALDHIICDEKVFFKVNRNHKYINLNIWGKCPGEPENFLLAYLNIPLLTIVKECSKSKINQYQKRFSLLPPELNLSVSKDHPLSAHSGFEPCLCYGDILFSFIWTNQMVNTVTSHKSNILSQDNKCIIQESESNIFNELNFIQTTTADENSVKQENVNNTWKYHNFLRTHFHRSTQCDFCMKKIWLKDAVQCRDCALCCHKKCVTKCLSTVRCQPPSSVHLQDDSLSPSQETSVSQIPEFLMTEHFDDSNNQSSFSSDTLFKEMPSQKSDESLLRRTAFTGLLGGLRRVGSAHCLSPLGVSASIPKSLPPSPQHTPRCQTPDEDAVWSVLETAVEDGVNGTADLLKPLIAAQLPSDILLSKAKDYGPRLLAHLPPNIRYERISNIVTDIRTTLDDESIKIAELHLKLADKNLSKQDHERQKRIIEEYEEKNQILTALLLHCCSAMQSVNKNDTLE